MLVDPAERDFPIGPRAALPKFDPAASLPGGIAWEFKPLEAAVTVLRAEYDPEARRVYFLLEAPRAFGSVGSDVRLEARTYDAKGLRTSYANLYFEQGTGVKKGERFRAYFEWSGDKRAARVVLLDPNEKTP